MCKALDLTLTSPGGLPLGSLSSLEVGSNPAGLAVSTLSPTDIVLNSKSSFQLAVFVSCRYFPRLCLRREHHQGDTHIQASSGVAHHIPRLHHARKSLVSVGLCFSRVLVTAAWGAGVCGCAEHGAEPPAASRSPRKQPELGLAQAPSHQPRLQECRARRAAMQRVAACLSSPFAFSSCQEHGQKQL